MKHHPLESIAESGRLFGLPSKTRWEFDSAEGSQIKPPKTALDRKKQPRAEWSPKVERPDYPVAKQHGDGVTGLQPQQSVKRFKIVVNDKVTGEPTEVLAKLVTNTLTAFAYGKSVPLFRKCNRGHSILDLRDGKRKDKQFVFNELRRMLGDSQGESAYRTLCSA